MFLKKPKVETQKMIFKKPKLICYDWDNTLLGTAPITLLSMNEIYKKYGHKELTMEDIYKINGYDFSSVFKAEFGEKHAKEIQDEYQPIYNKIAEDRLMPIEGALETVKRFHKLGIPQCVISNKPSFIVKPEAKKFGFSKYFEMIIGPDNTGYAKPDIRMFNPVKEKLDFKDKYFAPDKLWFFGDADADLNFAKVINARLFFFGDKQLVKNFPLDNLVMLNNHSDTKKILIVEDNSEDFKKKNKK